MWRLHIHFYHDSDRIKLVQLIRNNAGHGDRIENVRIAFDVFVHVE